MDYAFPVAQTSSVVNTDPDDWSPADNPYAIAVSQSQLWSEVVRLTVLRMQGADDQRVGWSSRQLDAHVLVMTLRQLLTAEQLEQTALTELGIDPAASAALAAARERFEDALPGIKDMRDALIHFDEHSRGLGQGPQAERRRAGEDLRDIARDFWRFGFDPDASTVTFCPYTIGIDTAVRAATELRQAIWIAAHAVDRKNTAQLRARTVEALSDGGIRHSASDAPLRVSPGNDLRIWLSFDLGPALGGEELRTLSVQIVGALAAAGLRLESLNQAEALDPAERLVQGELLYVAAEPAQPEEVKADAAANDVTLEDYLRIVAMAVAKLEEAERCAQAESFEPACVMVGAAVESALIAHVCIFQAEVRAAKLWRKRRNRKTNTEEEKPLLDWALEDLIRVAVKMKWLPVAAGVPASDPVGKLAGEVGDAVRFIQEVRNLVVHPGKAIRDEHRAAIGHDDYQVAYGVARAVFDHLYEAVEELGPAGV